MTSPRPGSRLQTTRAQSPVKSGLNPTASTNNHRSAGPYPGQTTTSSSSSSQRRGALFVDLVFADSARVPPLHEDNWDLPGDHNELASRMFSILGHPLGDDDAPSAFAFDDETALPGPSSKPMTTSNLHLLGTKRRELLETERTLVNRLIILQEHYERPLADLRARDGQLLVKKYHHTRMFNNLAKLVDAHKALDHRLHEVCASNSPLWAHVLAEHLERTTPQYVSYFAGYEHGSALVRSYTKSNKQFEEVLSNTKFATSKLPDSRNSDLLALLAEPVQRLPRYKYMLKDMLPLMPEDDPNLPFIRQIFKLVDDVSKYRDEEGRRAAILWSMNMTVQDMPFTLWSSQRRYLASVDVEDLPLDHRHSFSLDSRNSPEALTCTLFLFTDCLLITKRPDVRTSGRQVVGLDDIDALVHAANQPDFTNINHSSSSSSTSKFVTPASPTKGRPQSPVKSLSHQRSTSGGLSLKKNVLKARGLVPLNAITATDLGSKGFVLHLAQPPSHPSWSKRWNDQSLRHYTVSPTPGSQGLSLEKNNFIEALWDAQARCSGRLFANPTAPPTSASPSKKQADSSSRPPCTIFKTLLGDIRACAEWPIPEPMKSQQGWSVYIAAWAAEDYGETEGIKNRLAIHVDVTGRMTSRLVCDTSGPPNVVANATAEHEESLYVDIVARGRSDPVMSDSNIPPAGVLANSLQAALNLGIFNYVPKLALPAKPPGSPPMDYSRTRTGSLFGHSFLGKSSNIRNSVFGESTSSAASRADTFRSGTSGSTGYDSHTSSMFSHHLAPSTVASSAYSDTEDSPVMVSREPSHEDIYGVGTVPSPTKQRSPVPPPVPSKSTAPLSSIPRRVADESLLRANRFGSSCSISQILDKPEKMNMTMSVSDDSMGRSHSAGEIQQIQDAAHGSSRRRSASMPRELHAELEPMPTPPQVPAIAEAQKLPNPHSPKTTPKRKPVPKYEEDTAPAPAEDEDETFVSEAPSEASGYSPSRNNKRRYDEEEGETTTLPLVTKKSAVSALSLGTPGEGPSRLPWSTGRRESSGRFRRVSSMHDIPVPVPTPPPGEGGHQDNRKQVDELREALKQTQEENELLHQQQRRLDEEVQTAFDAFNEEIERAYNDMEQDFPDLQEHLLSDLQNNKLARYAAEVELRTLRRELALKDLRLRQYEALHGPLQETSNSS